MTTRLKTYTVLSAIAAEPTRMRDMARALGVPTPRLSGHLSWLAELGLIERTARGYWRRTAAGDRWLTVRAVGPQGVAA